MKTNFSRSIKSVTEMITNKNYRGLDYIHQISNNVFSALTELKNEDLDFISQKRDQIRHEFKTHFIQLQNEFKSKQKDYIENKEAVDHLKKLLNDDMNTNLDQFLFKIQKYFSSAKFKIGHLMSAPEIDLFEYAQSENVDKGTMDRYLSLYKTNIVNNYHSVVHCFNEL